MKNSQQFCCGILIFVMASAGGNQQFSVLDVEYKSVFLVYTPAPAIAISQGLWFPQSLSPVSVYVFDEFIDLLKSFLILSLPIQVIFSGLVRPFLTHLSVLNQFVFRACACIELVKWTVKFCKIPCIVEFFFDVIEMVQAHHYDVPVGLSCDNQSLTFFRYHIAILLQIIAYRSIICHYHIRSPCCQ